MPTLDQPRQIRLAEGQWEKCTEHAEAMEKDHPGLSVKPVAALRLALDRGLAELANDRNEERA